MAILRNLKYSVQNLSSRTIRELVVVAVLLCSSFAISLPAYFQDMKEYRKVDAQKKSDGWVTSTPELQGMDSALLSEADKFIRSPSVCSFIVVRHGYIVCEKYYNRSNEADYNNIYSVTKSVISALTGIAIQERFIVSTEDKVAKYLPEYIREVKDPRWSDITIRHLMTMTPGFCEDFTQWTGNGDLVKGTFDLPLLYGPGEKFQYANSASHLLSVLLTRATKMSTADFAGKYLFKPLGIENKEWSADQKGFNTGHADLFLRPRDMAKFGCLYLDKGKWNGTQVVPLEWVTESTKVQYDFNKEEKKGYENGYGFNWWINGQTGYHTYSALGYGGQSITVIPDLDVVIVITAMPGLVETVDDEKRFELLNRYIIPAVKDFK